MKSTHFIVLRIYCIRRVLHCNSVHCSLFDFCTLFLSNSIIFSFFLIRFSRNLSSPILLPIIHGLIYLFFPDFNSLNFVFKILFFLLFLVILFYCFANSCLKMCMFKVVKFPLNVTFCHLFLQDCFLLFCFCQISL